MKVKSFIDNKTSFNPTFAVQEPFSKKIETLYYRTFSPSPTVYEFLRKSYYTFGIPKTGIIHIGARHAEELDIYKAHNVGNVLWIEADTEAETTLREKVAQHPGSKVAIFAATNTNGTIQLHKTSNDGHSSSILPLKDHSIHYPGITESKILEVPTKRLDDFLSAEDKNNYNMIVIDVQGAELIALKGTEETLKHIDAVIAETNYSELYEGAVLLQDLDKFMDKHGFVRTDSNSVAYYTGDALYVKSKFFTPRAR